VISCEYNADFGALTTQITLWIQGFYRQKPSESLYALEIDNQTMIIQ